MDVYYKLKLVNPKNKIYKLNELDYVKLGNILYFKKATGKDFVSIFYGTEKRSTADFLYEVFLVKP